LNASGRHVRGAAALMLSLAVLAVPPALAEEPPPPPTAAPPAEGAEDLAPEPSAAPWQDTAAKVVDVFPIRLLGACATIVGFGAFIVSVPLVAPAGRMTAIRESWDYFVIGPYDYTFVRPLGEL
jgi:hypothetical protein